MYGLASKILGLHKYRVRFTYKDKNGRVVFHLTQTVSTIRQKYINRHRDIKVAFGPIAKQRGVEKQYLCNGTIEVEPTCYLGRW